MRGYISYSYSNGDHGAAHTESCISLGITSLRPLLTTHEEAIVVALLYL